jgi:hypothetical protein
VSEDNSPAFSIAVSASVTAPSGGSAALSQQRPALIEFGERRQQVVERDQIGGSLLRKDRRFAEREFPHAAAFRRHSRPRVFDQNLARQLDPDAMRRMILEG